MKMLTPACTSTQTIANTDVAAPTGSSGIKHANVDSTSTLSSITALDVKDPFSLPGLCLLFSTTENPAQL